MQQQVDDPPYLTVGTEVSAKYKGAFCEAKVRKVVRNIKCKVAYKQGLGSGTVSDDLIKCDLLRVGATVEVKHPDRRDTVEATITKIQDYSQYTVVFDDGDITTLRRSALCLKSGRHFNESETLDQLPLTHPEHFGNPVIGGRRGRSLELYKKSVVRSRHTPEESSEEDEEPEAAKPRIIEKEEHIGKIVCVESTDTKKKGPKENWFPALVVAPTAQDTVRIRVKDEYLVRSFKDGRYYTVPKKEATEFTREQATKQDNAAVQAALEYLHNDCLPAHWDREVLFGLGNSSSDFYNEFDSDTSDDEPTEEKDHFVAQLYKYMDDRGTPLNKGPSIINKDVDLYRLYRAVQKLGGYNRVTSQNQWKQIAIRLGFVPTTTSIQNLVKQAYKKFLLPFEEFDRKLGCSMVAHPRANRIKGRSLVRANSVASPKPDKEAKSATSAAEESENTSESSIDTKPKTKSIGKVKTLVDRYEEKVEETKREQLKEVKEKDLKPKEVKVKEKEKEPSTSRVVEIPATPSSKKKELNRRQPPPQMDDKKSRKKGKDSDVNEKTKVEVDEKDKSDHAANVPINVGDKLRVYYHEQKVTYEAKVIEISKQNETLLYLVHYTGWNTRYDEWVPKERIAENLTNSKTNKRTKTVAGKNDARSNSSTSEKLPGPSPIIRSSSKRNRVSSRGDSQPPRSTTPSSIASNSSRTKSPATPAQRRTTRGQPNKRRTSNNTDISSLQTDSDSDSDEPVVKKPTPKRKVVAAKAKIKRESATESIEIKKEKDLSSDEETLASTAAKTREYENQLRAELKGFNESDKPTTETSSSSTATMVEKKFDYIPKSEPETGASSASGTASSTITSRTKASPSNSSETDSYGDGDEDSQFSDRTGTLDSVSDKFNKFIIEKQHDMVATLKQSGIEKIIKSTLAEKAKAPPEKSLMKTLAERSPLRDKELERKFDLDASDDESNPLDDEDTQEETKIKAASVQSSSEKLTDVTIKVENDPVESDSSAEQKSDAGKSKPNESESSTGKSSQNPTDAVELSADITVKVETPEKNMPAPKQIYSDKSKSFGKSVIRQPIVSSKDDSRQSESDATGATSSASASSTCDIYEFKEPELFELETSKKLSPEIDKKAKRKTQAEPSKPSVSPPTASLPAKRAKKIGKEADKLKEAEGPKSPNPSGFPVKTETKIFDSLRKSPCYMTALDQVDETMMMNEDCPSTSEAIPVQQLQSEMKPLFINSFVDATLEETSKIFDFESSASDFKEDLEDLESVKKIMMSDEVLNQEPPKIDKPSSIADKVLKALHSQQQMPGTSAALADDFLVNEPSALEDSDPEAGKTTAAEAKPKVPPFEKVTAPSTSTVGSEPASGAATSSGRSTSTSTYRAGISPTAEASAIKPVLNKIDILESISPKNNDLSETIQKLESAIQKSAEHTHMSEDTSDSTDSEQRLIIEDESQSSETPNEFVLSKQESDQSYGGKQNTKEKSVSVSSTQTGPSDKKGHAADDKEKITEKTPAASLSAPGPVAASATVSNVVDTKSVDEPADSEQIALTVKTEEGVDKVCKMDDDFAAENAQNESISLLLCEETIPGSPAPACPKEQCDVIKKNYDSMFTSPLTVAEVEQKTVPTETSSTAVDNKPNKIKSGTPRSSPRDSMSQEDSSEENNKKQEPDRMGSSKKRRCTRKQSEAEVASKRRKATARRNTNTGNLTFGMRHDPILTSEQLNDLCKLLPNILGSESEDNSDPITTPKLQRPSKSHQYNFLVQLDPAMNSTQRITILKKKIQDLRKTYNMIKTELASIDRRRKKLRRREREMKKNVQKQLQQQQQSQQILIQVDENHPSVM